MNFNPDEKEAREKLIMISQMILRLRTAAAEKPDVIRVLRAVDFFSGFVDVNLFLVSFQQFGQNVDEEIGQICVFFYKTVDINCSLAKLSRLNRARNFSTEVENCFNSPISNKISVKVLH